MTSSPTWKQDRELAYLSSIIYHPIIILLYTQYTTSHGSSHDILCRQRERSSSISNSHLLLMSILCAGLLLAAPKSNILPHSRVHSYQARTFDLGSRKISQYMDLSFLPIEVDYLPPKTDLILKKATASYVQNDESLNWNLQEILQNIDDEYSFTHLPVIVANYSLDSRSDPDILAFCKILSFAVFNRLPIEIALVLMDNLPRRAEESSSLDKSPTIDPLILSMKSSLQKYGWRIVSFPRGLPLHVKRSTHYEKFVPFIRKSLLTRAHEISKANQAVHEAAITKAPMKRNKRDEIFSELANVKVGRSYMAESAQSISTVTWNYFPTRPIRRKLSKRVLDYSKKVISDRYGGYVVYLLLRLVWTFWRLFARSPFFISMIPLASTIEISSKLRTFYILSVILTRLVVSVLLSPSAEGAFRFLIKFANMRSDIAERLLKCALFCDSILLVTQILSS